MYIQSMMSKTGLAKPLSDAEKRKSEASNGKSWISSSPATAAILVTQLRDNLGLEMRIRVRRRGIVSRVPIAHK
ncbi:hypothetical protein POX_a00304 [Penicillium oxalicum]|uniref:Uncharacterized protein n=1 Tax=Penicillium oxalicum (strain 114-2 / CGMCC 5302) TaxID=933388 RepID=S8A0R3_PENO1|nr:hypothetical protein POX_a00304 [Penicillium oxalicum]EPS34726.1 hypothetical protein PDE_09690 [Penicillium oxalicum 114-2]KAI2793720.1 hypothetical protein POX_a00304 [Penicillium oxalicum]